jgi:hypothetical protein
MIEDIFTVNLPVNERLILKRNRFDGKKNSKRVSIITGIHGDELEGQYVAFLLANWLLSNQDKIDGIIDIYPSMNPMGIDSITRGFPFYDVDINRVFPGNKSDFLPSQLADAIVESVKGSDIAIDIHASNIFLREIPQVRISKEFENILVPLANQINIDFIWIHDAVTVLQSTFSHTLNRLGTKTLVVEMGVGMRITKDYCQNLFNGILNLLNENGIIRHNVTLQKREVISNGEVFYINAKSAGIFVPELNHCANVTKNQLIGNIINPLEGIVIEEILSPVDGLLFTIREYPVVYEGSLIARIFQERS